ncbi:MAG: hypothetical protein ACYS9Y_12250 [Planctomycetota bacterium]
MQNKPNFSNNPMNINFFFTNCYEQKPPLPAPAKQTQFKPNQTQTNPIPPLFLDQKLASNKPNQLEKNPLDIITLHFGNFPLNPIVHNTLTKKPNKISLAQTKSTRFNTSIIGSCLNSLKIKVLK